MNNKVLKATMWYTISSILVKGMGFLTTPFFSRILTQSEYGSISNYSSWCSLLATVTTLCIASTLVRARFDFEKEFNNYIKSTLFLGMLVTVISFGIIFFRISFFTDIFSLERKYVVLLFAHCLVTPAYDYFLLQQRFLYKYKIVVGLSLGTTIGSTLLSFILIYFMKDKMLARILGLFLLQFILGAILLIKSLLGRGRITTKYWKYALAIAVPYVFHLLGSLILHSSDKAIITKICGPVDNALYSMAYNIAMIVNVFLQALNNAFAPWLGERLNVKDYSNVRKFSYGMIGVFGLGIVGIMLITPDAILILGGHKYAESMYIVPPIMLGYFFMFIQTLYANVEQFEKKTTGMAVATSIAAVFNLGTNLIFIPIFGYSAAAYTTMISFALMTVFHYLFLKRMKMHQMFDNKFMLLSVIGMAIITVFMVFIYKNSVIRYLLLIIYLISVIGLTLKNRRRILALLRR